MTRYQVGEWVKGPFASATIEGFIVQESHGTYSISVKRIESNLAEGPKNLKVGSIHILPKKVIDEFYIVLNSEQQQNLVALAVDLREDTWAKELVYQFYNPNPPGVIADTKNNSNFIYSNILNRFVELDESERYKLYEFYTKVISKGVPGKVRCFKELNNSDNFDAVISAIVLISKDREGMNYIESLLNKTSK